MRLVYKVKHILKYLCNSNRSG